MNDFRTRLIEEHQSVEDRLNKLLVFIKSDKLTSIPTIQQVLLKAQYNAMLTYEIILRERINLL